MGNITASQFTQLMQTIADGWDEGDVHQSADCFSEEAVYIEPPDKQVCHGRRYQYKTELSSEEFTGYNSFQDFPMKYEIIHNGTQIPKIGFGTWQIGGGSYADPSLDSASLAALRSALEVGYTHFDTAEGYASGHCEELVGRGVHESKAKREDLFITTKVAPEHLRYNDVLRACENSLRRLGMDYIDLYLVHWPGPMGTNYAENFRALNELVRAGKVKRLGVSNFKLKLLKQAQQLSETPIVTDQVPYRLPDRTYAKNGILEYCQQNDILVTAYSPVKFRNLPVNKTIRAIADAHSATPYQIALAWLVAQRRVITIPMSFNPQHIRENFVSADIELTEEEFKTLSALW